jgi:hypothetical protein
MTFTEAAEAVLRKVGKPLHYKKITQLAIEQNLLSHVGKTPEVTMSTRLATLAKKDRGEAPIVRVKPGVFGLRDWGEAAVAAAADEPEGEEVTDAEIADSEEGAEEAPVATVTRSAEEQERAQRVAAAANLFPEEDDDDVPVFAEKPVPLPPPAPAPAANANASAGGSADKAGAQDGDREGGRRRRRRRRRGRGSERGEAGAPVGAEGAAGEPGEAFEAEDPGDDLLPEEEERFGAEEATEMC